MFSNETEGFQHRATEPPQRSNPFKLAAHARINLMKPIPSLCLIVFANGVPIKQIERIHIIGIESLPLSSLSIRILGSLALTLSLIG